MATIETILWCKCTESWEQMKVIETESYTAYDNETFKCPKCGTEIILATTTTIERSK